VSTDLFDHLVNIRGTLPGTASSPLASTGGLTEIADVYFGIESQRLVLLGRAGSGKTVVISRFVLDYLARRSPGRPVPVIFSIGSWDPTTPLRDWLADRLLRDHPHLATRVPGGTTLAVALVEDGGILPVLDGFDEIATGSHGTALEELNSTSLPFVLTSRTAQYVEAVEATDVLTGAAGYELVDLTAEDLADYLPRTARPTGPEKRDGTAPTVWDPVLTRLRAQPDSPACANLAAALRTPLMVLLARTVYSDTPDQDPANLLDMDRFPTPQALEDHLLADFVPTVYRRHPSPRPGRQRRQRTWDPQRAQHYLSYLAEHLDRQQEHDHQNLAWWRLGGSLRPSLRILAVVVACTVITAVSDWLIVLPMDAINGVGVTVALREGILEALLFGPAVGLAFGLVYGLLVVFGGTVFRPSCMQLRLPGRYRRSGGAPARKHRTWFSAGLFGGLVLGLGYSPAYTLEQELLFGHTFYGGRAVESTLTNVIVFGLVFGPTAGLVFGSIAVLETPLDTGAAATPVSLLTANRTTVLREVLLLLPTLALAIALCGWLITGLLQGLLGPLSWSLAGGLSIGVIGGVIGSLSYAIAFTAWGQWVLLARIWLPLTGRMPWAITAFLDDAYRRGVLRQAGAVYQFRHARLQRHLRRRWSSRNDRAGTK
jgi:hypothetical protein